jgi:hypothetical protein
MSQCASCQDFGIKESIAVGSLDSIASYCHCPAGYERAQNRDDAFPPDRVNAARQKLKARFGEKKLPGLQPAAQFAEDLYRGEF